MSSVTSSGCCSPICNDCVQSAAPTCPHSPRGKSIKDPENKKQPVCSNKNCEIFGAHDTNSFPEYPYPARRIKTTKVNLNSLGSPIGMVASNINLKTEGNPTNMTQARYATYLKAFARLHLNAETTWTSKVIDDILKEGLLLYTTSEKDDNKLQSPADIYTANESNVLREFALDDCNFHIELMPKFNFNNELGADGDGEMLLEGLKLILKSFFHQHTYCLLAVKSFYIMIWHANDVYFILDICGRRTTDFNRDSEHGVAMLMCLNTLDNIKHLLINLSALRKTEPICVRELKIVKVTTASGNVIQRDYGTRTHQYQIVNDDYACLRAKLHLTLNKLDLLRNRSALAVCIAAIVVSKIDHPATWNIKMIDKIFCFGVNFCKNCWIKCLVNERIDVTEFPSQFSMAQFRITTELIARKCEGIWRCIPGFRYSELAQAIEREFKVGEQKLLIQIYYQMYAIWKNDGFIYLLDPYRHRILGKENESNVYQEMEKSATVRMFRSFEVFINTFNQILLDSNRTNQFFVHILRIKNIQHSSKKEEEVKIDENGEVISINKHICFDEPEDLCQKTLGEISDYEDEDLLSDVDEMELKTSSSEAEDIMGEEEQAAVGEAEEIEGLESSSSGEEGGGHDKKTGRKKGTKGGSGNKGSKEGKRKEKKRGKGNKGKEARDKDYDTTHRKNEDDSSDEEDNVVVRSKTNRSKHKKPRDNEDKGHGSAKDKNDKDTDTEDKDEYAKTKDQDNRLKGKKDRNKVGNEEGKNKDHGGKVKGSKDQNKVEGDEVKVSKDHNKMHGDEVKGSKDQNKVVKDKNEEGKTQHKDNMIKNVQDKDKVVKDKSEDAKNKGIKDNVGKDKNGDGKNKYQGDKDAEKDGNVDDKSENKNKDNNKNKISQENDKDKGKEGINTNKYNEDKDQKDLSTDLNKNPNMSKQEVNKKGYEDKIVINKYDGKDNLEKDNDKDAKIEADRYRQKDINKTTDTTTQKDQDKYKDIDKVRDKGIKDIDNKDNEKDNNKENDKNNTINNITETKTIKEYVPGPGLDLPKLHSDVIKTGHEYNDNFIDEVKCYCCGPNPNRYPGYFKTPLDMTVVGTRYGSYESICKLFQAGFKLSDRVLILTPWGNFIVFRCLSQIGSEEKHYFLFVGCTCNVNRFRHLDLSIGTAGLICFEHLHNVIGYIRRLRKNKNYENPSRVRKYTADDICSQYCC